MCIAKTHSAPPQSKQSRRRVYGTSTSSESDSPHTTMLRTVSWSDDAGGCAPQRAEVFGSLTPPSVLLPPLRALEHVRTVERRPASRVVGSLIAAATLSWGVLKDELLYTFGRGVGVEEAGEEDAAQALLREATVNAAVNVELTRAPGHIRMSRFPSAGRLA